MSLHLIHRGSDGSYVVVRDLKEQSIGEFTHSWEHGRYCGSGPSGLAKAIGLFYKRAKELVNCFIRLIKI